MDKYMLLTLAVLLPALSAALCYVLRKSVLRNIIVFLTTAAMFAVAGGMVYLVMQSGGKVIFNLEELHLPIHPGMLIKMADFVLLAYITWIGLKLKKPLIIGLSIIQAIALFGFEMFGNVKEPHISFIIDYLSLVMILLVSVIGPIITVFATGYMKEHEHHLHLEVSRQPRFFMVLFVFLSAMNALVMTNDLSWMLFFFGRLPRCALSC